MRKKVVFISDIFTPYSTRSSTQLLIQSALYALSKMDCDLFFIGIYDFMSDESKIIDFLNSLGIEYLLVPSKINVEKNGKYKNVFLLLFETLFPKSVFDDKIKLPFVPDIIISSIPSVEAWCIGSVIKRKNIYSRFIAFWTDVMAFNYLDSSKHTPFSRLPYYYIEKRILKSANNSFFLGECQCNFMKKAYQKYSNKMSYYYPSFYPFAKEQAVEHNQFTVLYFGNMNKKMRDVSSLCEASNHLPYVEFFLEGTGDIQTSQSNENLHYSVLIKKISDFDEAISIESKADISIVFLNKHGFSLPGKLFYYLHFKRATLVIKDGPYKDDIEKQLSKFNCFYFCENNSESIISAIKIIKEKYNSKAFNPSSFDPLLRYSFLINLKRD